MANLRDAKTIINNARALELFMRVSPEAASFLDCFSFGQAPGNTCVAFSYDIPWPSEDDIAMLTACQKHFQCLFAEVKSKLKKSIDSPFVTKLSGLPPESETPEKTRKIVEREHADLQLLLNLEDTRLKDVILDLTLRMINERHGVNPDYTLSYFPTRDILEENSSYTGIIEKEALQKILREPFAKDVRKKDLEDLLPQLTVLEKSFCDAKLPERYR